MKSEQKKFPKKSKPGYDELWGERTDKVRQRNKVVDPALKQKGSQQQLKK